MQENIFAPLGMENSTFLLDEVDPALLASPHVMVAGEAQVANAFPYSRQFAASNNLFSNVEDMAKLAQSSLNRGEVEETPLLPSNAYDLMWTPSHKTPYGTPWSHWGAGWFMTEIAGHPVMWMGGADRGFEANAMLVPDENLAVIAMGNGPNSGNYYTPWITIDLMEAVFDQTADK